MPKVPLDTLFKYNALNYWLQDVFVQKMPLVSLLKRGGLSDEQITKLQEEHLTPYIESALAYVQTLNDGHDGARRHEAMVRYYGLVNGRHETLQKIADDYGLTRERIRQIKDKRLLLFKNDEYKAKVEEKLAALALEFLSKSQS